jgi:excisionase family DNA binding protein
MSDFLTTREVASLLRVKERKVYDLVANDAIPVRKVTGKLLFPKSEVEAWMRGSAAPAEPLPAAVAAETVLPLVFAGGHDPLLEWALRQSRSGIASFLDGALDGLARAGRGDCMAAGLHVPQDDGDWNVAAVRAAFASEPWVLVEWVRRRRGLILAPDLARKPGSLAEVRGLRFQGRQPESGSHLILIDLLARERMSLADLQLIDSCERSETDLAAALASGRADVGLGIAGAACQFGLRFVPLVEERFDLLVARKAWFDPPFQTFWRFCLTPAFAEKAAALGGYDISSMGTVRFNGG